MTELRPGMSVTSSIRLERPLGVGGMGSVWVAEHLALRTQVVVKFMSAELAASPEAVARFSREAASAAQIKSPHVVQMLDHGVTSDNIPFIAMELLEGRDLAHRLNERGGRLPLSEIAAVVSQVARALSRAHERGIVHRDIKPDNIFLCDAGGGETFVKLLDFGIAKGVDGGGGLGGGTKTGATIGTPYYMSPEQLVGSRSLDARSDLWSLGIVAYQAVVGARPFDAETFGALAVIIHTAPLPTPSRVAPDVPAAFDAWFAKACAREPAARFATARELADALSAIARGEAWAPGAPPAPLLGGGTVALPAFALGSTPPRPPVTGCHPALPAPVLGAAPLAGGATDGGLGLRTGSLPASGSRSGRRAGIGLALVVVGLGGLGAWWASRSPRSAAPAAAASEAAPAPAASAPVSPSTPGGESPEASAATASAAPPVAATAAPSAPVSASASPRGPAARASPGAGPRATATPSHPTPRKKSDDIF